MDDSINGIDTFKELYSDYFKLNGDCAIPTLDKKTSAIIGHKYIILFFAKHLLHVNK